MIIVNKDNAKTVGATVTALIVAFTVGLFVDLLREVCTVLIIHWLTALHLYWKDIQETKMEQRRKTNAAASERVSE